MRRRSRNNLVERVFTKLLEATTQLPPDDVLNDLASKQETQELDEDEFKRGEWQPGIDESIKIRATPETEIDIEGTEIPEGASGKIINHIVAYKISFNDEELGERWVTKAMMEPTRR